ncbi:hypothetical protein NPIL_702051 [Nephila pilipes]|uniref:Uncharacterized protein n=1 Tax=Nephila pilipes TaxID=299642 RepID=A0A8X6Q9E5_NEPPI|nr:hypothetical protein NPIL_702051 [Nephila pilipes]
MQCLSSPTTRHHEQNTIFVRKNLITCNYIFHWTNSIKKGLQSIYEGSYKVVDHTESVFRILRRGKEVSMSVVRLKTAYVPKELADIPAGGSKGKKMSSQTYEVSGSSQKTTTHSLSE